MVTTTIVIIFVAILLIFLGVLLQRSEKTQKAQLELTKKAVAMNQSLVAVHEAYDKDIPELMPVFIQTLGERDISGYQTVKTSTVLNAQQLFLFLLDLVPGLEEITPKYGGGQTLMSSFIRMYADPESSVVIGVEGYISSPSYYEELENEPVKIVSVINKVYIGTSDPTERVFKRVTAWAEEHQLTNSKNKKGKMYIASQGSWTGFRLEEYEPYVRKAPELLNLCFSPLAGTLQGGVAISTNGSSGITTLAKTLPMGGKILLLGGHGTGKTTLTRQIIAHAPSGAVVVQVTIECFKNSKFVDQLKDVLKSIREEGNYPVVVADDQDELILKHDIKTKEQAVFGSILDGINGDTFPTFALIVTTNLNQDQLSPILTREGRFNLVSTVTERSEEQIIALCEYYKGKGRQVLSELANGPMTLSKFYNQVLIGQNQVQYDIVGKTVLKELGYTESEKPVADAPPIKKSKKGELIDKKEQKEQNKNNHDRFKPDPAANRPSSKAGNNNSKPSSTKKAKKRIPNF